MDEARMMRERIRTSLWSTGVLLPVIMVATASVPAALARTHDVHAAGGPSRGIAAVAPVTVTDVSPDAACCPGANWGPAEGGQIGAIAVDPNNAAVVYAGGEAGGVWKSTDAGA